MEAIEPWYSVAEISRHLGVSKETIYRWLEREVIPAHRMGRLWKFKASEVDEWVFSGQAGEMDPKKISRTKLCNQSSIEKSQFNRSVGCPQN